MRLSPLLSVFLLLGGCGTTNSADPIYPPDWPALASVSDQDAAPDLVGTYRAVSDPAGPMVYPDGGQPREVFLLVPGGPPEQAPRRVGRRVLPWHLAGIDDPTNDPLWKRLQQFDAALRPDATHPDGQDGLGWVRISSPSAGRLNIDCGVGYETLASFLVSQQSSFINLGAASHRFTLAEGGLSVSGQFPLSLTEYNFEHRRRTETDFEHGRRAGGTFTFHRAMDGSLVAVEDLYFWPGDGSGAFRKWWRWRRIDGR